MKVNWTKMKGGRQWNGLIWCFVCVVIGASCDGDFPTSSMQHVGFKDDFPSSPRKGSQCSCVPIDLCPRWYGQSAVDVRELGILEPCSQYGTVRCCGVSITVVVTGKRHQNIKSENTLVNDETKESSTWKQKKKEEDSDASILNKKIKTLFLNSFESSSSTSTTAKYPQILLEKYDSTIRDKSDSKHIKPEIATTSIATKSMDEWTLVQNPSPSSFIILKMNGNASIPFKNVNQTMTKADDNVGLSNTDQRGDGDLFSSFSTPVVVVGEKKLYGVKDLQMSSSEGERSFEKPSNKYTVIKVPIEKKVNKESTKPDGSVFKESFKEIFGLIMNHSRSAGQVVNQINALSTQLKVVTPKPYLQGENSATKNNFIEQKMSKTIPPDAPHESKLKDLKIYSNSIQQQTPTSSNEFYHQIPPTNDPNLLPTLSTTPFTYHSVPIFMKESIDRMSTSESLKSPQGPVPEQYPQYRDFSVSSTLTFASST